MSVNNTNSAVYNANETISAHEYRYDKRGNIVKKILPQCQYTQYWYDHGDKVIFMQDANLRTKNKYRFMLYDRLGRLCVQGLCDDFDRSVNVSDINISVVYNQGVDGLCNTGYVLSMALGLKNVRLEKAYYYDNYDFLSGGMKAAFGEVTPTLPGFSSINANGLLTGTVLSTSDGTHIIMHNRNKFNVRFSINLHLYNNKEKENPFIILDSWNSNSRKNYIELKNMDSQSFTRDGDEGTWRSSGRYGLQLSYDDPAPHEVGHLLGEEDKYNKKNPENPRRS